MPGRVLIVEDDNDIRTQTAAVLHDEGYDTDEAATGTEGVARLERQPVDCVLLDVMLPDVDGFEVCRRLRARSDVPIIMVTARTDSVEVVAGLEAGADDYVTKPFEPKELAARIRAMLRRTQGTFGANPMVMRLGGRVEIRPDEGSVLCNGDEVHLTRTEFRLLCELAGSPGRLFSREALLESVWGYDFLGDSKVVDVHIHRIRAKIERDPAHPEHLITVRGLGYKAVA